ncbi:MAG: linear amide C-N hydrolase [Candidatus Amulumruptor caecigallinarius]|nr:linear amide C-N hydrolase [Candidatus Amulumruptor caecigallinarius]
MKTSDIVKSAVVGGTLAITAFNPFQSDACSRILYEGKDNLFVVARSLDWKTPIPTNLYVYPRGMEKVSTNLSNPIKWTSKYGAVYAVGYDGGVTEGMNEKGLVVSGLFCKGTVYNDSTKVMPHTMSLSVFVAWLLDMNATTDEVVKALKDTQFEIQGATFDSGTVSALHWGVTDATGKSVIFEFDHGKINVYDMGDYRAMTNDPTWPAMTAIIDYWRKIGGKNMLPGTVTSADRCVRADYFAHHVEPVSDGDLGVSIARSILANSSVPYTYMIEGEPNLSSTQWRTYSNIRDKKYYFDLVTNSGIYYVDLNKVDLRKGAPVMKLDTSKTTDLVGDATGRLVASAPFTPMY